MRLWKYIFLFLLLVGALLAIALFQVPDSRLHLVACNVGQGDATLLTYRNIQVLVDGGPDKKVLDCLGKYLPFWDREIELVILTHPDSDHFSGLTDVFKSYSVDNFLTSPITISKPEYKVLENAVGRGHSTLLKGSIGQTLRLGLIQLDILNPLEWPEADFSDGKVAPEMTDAKTNPYSIVSLVSFGKFRALLTGDMTPEVSDRLAGNWFLGPVNYIKIPHHGSRNGLTQNLLEKLVPGDLPRNEVVGVISVGKNNYGQPDEKILEMLKNFGVNVFRTDRMGDVEIVTNGRELLPRRWD